MLEDPGGFLDETPPIFRRRLQDRVELTLADDGVVGGADRALEGDADGAFPGRAHAFSGMAAPALAVGIAGEYRGPDAGQVALVQPGGGGRHDFIAVIEHERIAVGMAEEIERGDGAFGAGVDGADEVAAAVDPDELDAILGGKL